MRAGWMAITGLAVVLWQSMCLAHGVDHTVLEGGVGVEARYDSGQAMAYCEAKVFSPTNAETEFQQGITDRNGRFMFYPDGTGVWHVSVDDGMGHMFEGGVPVSGVATAAEALHGRMSHCHAAVLGVSLIFGFFGLYSLFLSRRGRIRRH